MVTRRYEVSGDTYTGKDMGSIAANLGKAEIRPFYAVDFELDDTPLHFWTGLGDLTLGSVTYTGAGNLLTISALSETSDVRSAGANISLSGIPGSLLSLALQTKYHGRIARIKFGLTALNQDFLLQESGDYLLQESGAAISVSIGDAQALTTLFVGYMDQMIIDEGGDTSTISVSLESKLVDLERPRPIRYTTESQRVRFPNFPPDKAFEYVADLQDKPLMWGRGVKMGGGGGMF